MYTRKYLDKCGGGGGGVNKQGDKHTAIQTKLTSKNKDKQSSYKKVFLVCVYTSPKLKAITKCIVCVRVCGGGGGEWLYVDRVKRQTFCQRQNTNDRQTITK